jgi:hypothetical protein
MDEAPAQRSTGRMSPSLPTTAEDPEERAEGGYRDEEGVGGGGGGVRVYENHDSQNQAAGAEGGAGGGGPAPVTADAAQASQKSAIKSPTSPTSPIKIKVDYGPDGKNSVKYQKMVGTMKDLELKQVRDGKLKLMEERQYALLVRQVNKMDAEAARLDEEARIKAEEDARFKPRGIVSWTVEIQELDESAMGMRVGLVHRSLQPGEDWGDYSSANNKAWWWNSYSGNLFVGDVMVPESGNVNRYT